MSDSGGRRIMREYALKLDYIKPCTPEFLEKMKAFDDELAQFITGKQQQAAEGRVANTDNPAGLVNGTIDTNVGLLRAYMALYLRRHPFINKDLDLMVRTLAPTGNGLPVQIYCFSSNKNWPSYESIQAEIMEHFVSVLPVFELYAFQSADARDTIISGLIESGKVDLVGCRGDPLAQRAADRRPGVTREAGSDKKLDRPFFMCPYLRMGLGYTLGTRCGIRSVLLCASARSRFACQLFSAEPALNQPICCSL